MLNIEHDFIGKAWQIRPFRWVSATLSLFFRGRCSQRLLKEKHKSWSKPPGVACAGFLSSWLGVLRQLRCLQRPAEIEFCSVEMNVTESREYASGTLKADAAAQPKGCSACFVPAATKCKTTDFFQASQHRSNK